jgi:hypothetical protein
MNDGNELLLVWDFDLNRNMCGRVFEPRTPVSPNDWSQTWLRPWLRIDTSHTYYVMQQFSVGLYFRNTNALAGGPVTRNGITFQQSFQTTQLYPLKTAPTLNSNANAIDVLFQAD